MTLILIFLFLLCSASLCCLQMAGYATKWAGSKLGFVTVHGAGHEVPTYKPEVALYLWKNYLSGAWTN